MCAAVGVGFLVLHTRSTGIGRDMIHDDVSQVESVKEEEQRKSQGSFD